MSADEKERLEKIEFSIRMLYFHNYINDTQFIKMMDKLNKEIKELKSKEYCQVCGVELTEKNKYMKSMCYDCKYGEE